MAQDETTEVKTQAYTCTRIAVEHKKGDLI